MGSIFKITLKNRPRLVKTKTKVDKNSQEKLEENVKFKFELNPKFGAIPKVRRQTDIAQ